MGLFDAKAGAKFFLRQAECNTRELQPSPGAVVFVSVAARYDRPDVLRAMPLAEGREVELIAFGPPAPLRITEDGTVRHAEPALDATGELDRGDQPPGL